jgi:hypothetical protein
VSKNLTGYSDTVVSVVSVHIYSLLSDTISLPKFLKSATPVWVFTNSYKVPPKFCLINKVEPLILPLAFRTNALILLDISNLDSMDCDVMVNPPISPAVAVTVPFRVTSPFGCR